MVGSAIGAVSILVAFFAAADPGGGRAEFEKANTFFEAQEYDAALPLYRQAYERSGKRPSTIRALAQCERALKLYDDALVHFREYLATGPEDAAQIVETVKLIEALRAERLAAKADKPAPAQITETGPPPAQTQANEDESIFASPVFWIVAGAVVVAGGAVAIGIAASGTREPYGGTEGFVLHP